MKVKVKSLLFSQPPLTLKPVYKYTPEHILSQSIISFATESTANGHLQCLPCHQVMLAGALVNCPNCREPMGNNMNWLAKTLIENIEHECTNQDCTKRLFYQEVTMHKKELCKYRDRKNVKSKSVCTGVNFHKKWFLWSVLG